MGFSDVAMNFLGHYYLDRNHPSSLFALGAATPDLLSIYNENFRVKHAHVRPGVSLDIDWDHLPLLEGMRRHFHADNLFHSSDFFNENTAFATQELKRRFKTNEFQRKFFISHVLLELLLDKALIDREKDILHEYYTHFAVHWPFSSVKEATEKVSRHSLPNYDHFLDKFLSNKYLTHYKEWDHIIFVLGRIMRRAGVDHPEFLDDPAMTTYLADLQEKITPQIPKLFEDLRKG